MHFIANLFKIKYFPIFLSIWEKLSKYAFKFHNFLYCSHYILFILHRIYWFQQYVFPIEEFQGNRIQLSECMPVRQRKGCIIYHSPQITNSLRHFSLIKKIHWMRYHQAPARYDWNPSLLIQEVNRTAVPELEKSIILN